ncbi:MAG TPA: HEAT repeat domain-containing protein, partial [Blastocatellia bacterium]|nr:HEAT repeat domain-containing protein [Blastocatellia bacterium]
KQAIFGLTQIRGAESVSFISQLYDTEQDPEIKEHLLHALSESHSKEALNKLMQIARTDPSLKNRKTAVFRLGQSRDPEVLKFLEELLK